MAKLERKVGEKNRCALDSDKRKNETFSCKQPTYAFRLVCVSCYQATLHTILILHTVTFLIIEINPVSQVHASTRTLFFLHNGCHVSLHISHAYSY
jgi:hypothetical protein